MKAGSNGRIFGAVKTQDVVDAVVALGIGAIDKRKVEISSKISSVGEYEATVRVTADLVATVKLQVVAAK